VDANAFCAPGGRPADERKQLVRAGVDAAIGQEANEVEGVVGKGFGYVPRKKGGVMRQGWREEDVR